MRIHGSLGQTVGRWGCRWYKMCVRDSGQRALTTLDWMMKHRGAGFRLDWLNQSQPRTNRFRGKMTSDASDQMQAK